jgi:rubrerythrin
MLSKIPIMLAETIGKEDPEKQVLRAGIIAELDAINLYQQMAAMIQDQEIQKVLLDIMNEEKTHMGEFLSLLLKKDVRQGAELEKGKKEVEELTR